MNARLIAVSGLGAKEPAAFVVEANGHRLLLDCGEGPEPGRLPDFNKVGPIDAILLSHGHADHAGALRFRDKIGMPPVYATEPVLSRLKDATGQPIPIRGRSEILGIAVETGANGHAPGGVWIRLAVGDGFIYMGDHSPESRLYNFDTPPKTATIVIDGSYGTNETTIDGQRGDLVAIAARGPVLLPLPGDGRGPDIAMFLQDEGFDVAIDDTVRAVAAMLMSDGRASVRDENMPRLAKLVREARRLDETSEPQGVMVSHGGSGDVGVAGALIKRWMDRSDVAILFTGHLAVGMTGRTLVDNGRALFQRWNVHPRFADNLRLVETVGATVVVPAFGDPKFVPAWQARLPQCKLVSETPILL
jgi:Cft2 family RNA processing exonuclease